MQFQRVHTHACGRASAADTSPHRHVFTCVAGMIGERSLGSCEVTMFRDMGGCSAGDQLGCSSTELEGWVAARLPDLDTGSSPPLILIALQMWRSVHSTRRPAPDFEVTHVTGTWPFGEQFCNPINPTSHSPNRKPPPSLSSNPILGLGHPATAARLFCYSDRLPPQGLSPKSSTHITMPCTACRIVLAVLCALLQLAPAHSDLILAYSIQRHGARNVLSKSALLTESDATGGPTLLPAGQQMCYAAGACAQNTGGRAFQGVKKLDTLCTPVPAQ